jgi:hypothetical protein
LFRESTPQAAPLGRHADGPPGVPRLDARDALVNRSVLERALARVGTDGGARCDQPARGLAVQKEGVASWVRIAPRVVCQLRELKRISVAQPGVGAHGVAEVGAFLIGKRVDKTVDVGRVVVPPFTFGRDRLDFVAADLGALAEGETLVGTWHTHPDGDLEEGLLSTVDLEFLRRGSVDFHGAIGRFADRRPGLDFLFHVVDPRDGGWNVYAHDGAMFGKLLDECRGGRCPLNALRTPGTPYFALARTWDLPRDSLDGGLEFLR